MKTIGKTLKRIWQNIDDGCAPDYVYYTVTVIIFPILVYVAAISTWWFFDIKPAETESFIVIFFLRMLTGIIVLLICYIVSGFLIAFIYKPVVKTIKWIKFIHEEEKDETE